LAGSARKKKFIQIVEEPQKRQVNTWRFLKKTNGGSLYGTSKKFPIFITLSKSEINTKTQGFYRFMPQRTEDTRNLSQVFSFFHHP